MIAVFKKLKQLGKKQNKNKDQSSFSEKKGRAIKGLSGKNSKSFITADDSLLFNSEQNFIKAGINEEAREVLKKAFDNPEELVSFIKSRNTKVIKSRFIKPLLCLFGEQEGFIPPISGLRALAFSFLVNTFCPIKIDTDFKTPALFALDDKPVNIYLFSHQFHLWLSYINELPGFDEKTRKNFKNIWESNNNSMNMRQLSAEDLLSLKDAVARDLEALNFVKDMAREFIGQRQVLEKIRQKNSASI